MAISELQVVGNPFRRVLVGICRRTPDVDSAGEVIAMLQYMMFSTVGWMIVHVVAICALFLLGYSVHF
jgi:hypothetical protein